MAELVLKDEGVNKCFCIKTHFATLQHFVKVAFKCKWRILPQSVSLLKYQSWFNQRPEEKWSPLTRQRNQLNLQFLDNEVLSFLLILDQLIVYLEGVSNHIMVIVTCSLLNLQFGVKWAVNDQKSILQGTVCVNKWTVGLSFVEIPTTFP